MSTPILIRNYYTRELPVDEDVSLTVRVRRFTKDQLAAFQIGWSRCENPPSDRVIYRKPDEIEKDEHERFVIADAEIRRRRLQEMTPDEMAAFTAQEEADVRYIATFCDEQIRAHVWVAPGQSVQSEDDNGAVRPVATGADLADLFAGNLAMLTRLTRVIYDENTLPPEQKKTLRPRYGLPRGSTATPVAVGETPAATLLGHAGESTTAAPAAPLDSVSPGDASDLPAMSLSSETA